jgi:hypothetical protein
LLNLLYELIYVEISLEYEKLQEVMINKERKFGTTCKLPLEEEFPGKESRTYPFPVATLLKIYGNLKHR